MSGISTPMQLKVVSLNCWGVPVTARHRKERMKAISAALMVSSFDIVALQEVWVPRDRTFLITAGAAGGLTHAHHFASGVSGSGLLLLSRYPIVEHQFLRYSMCGKPYKVHQADWFGGKGVGLLRVACPGSHTVDVYVTHLTARYAKADEYAATRAVQALECARFVLQTQRSALAVLVGDFNAEPDSLEHRIITQLGELHDLWLACGPRAATASAGDAGAVAASGAVDGATFCNSYCARDDMAYNMRIDYVFARLLPQSHHAVQLDRVRSTQPPPPMPVDTRTAVAGLAADIGVLCPLRVCLALDNVPQEGAGALRGVPHYSDHTGLRADFELQPSPDCALLTAPAPAVTQGAGAAAVGGGVGAGGGCVWLQRHASLLSELSRAVDSGVREAALRRRWHYRQAAGGLALWLLLVVLAVLLGSRTPGSGSGAIWGSFLAPLAIVYSVSHVFLAELFVRQEAAALSETSEQIAVMLQHGFRV